MQKLIPLLFAALFMAGCAGEKVVTSQSEVQAVEVIRHVLDPKKVKTIRDIQDVFQMWDLYFAYPATDKAQAEKYAKYKRLFK